MVSTGFNSLEEWNLPLPICEVRSFLRQSYWSQKCDSFPFSVEFNISKFVKRYQIETEDICRIAYFYMSSTRLCEGSKTSRKAVKCNTCSQQYCRNC